MHQLIALVSTLVIAFLLNASHAAQASAAGNWGEAIGGLIFGPIVMFYVVHSIIYWLTRALRGRERVRAYTQSRLNYIALAVTVLGVLGSLAQNVHA